MSTRATRYVLGRRLGEGGMGEVFAAVAHGLGAFERRVAIKRIRAEMMAITGVRRAFSEEALIASRLHHANIVAILDYGSVGEVPFQVFELVDGLNLRELRARVVESGTRISEELALSIALSVAHALLYAHELCDEDGRPLGIVHRDVSPQNVLVSWAGDVKLADFGVAKAAVRTDVTAAGFIKGNRSFMSPEQAAGAAVDARADVFALGAVLHWFLSGASPVESEEARQAAVGGADPAISGELAEDLTRLIRAATRASRSARTATMRELAEQIAAALMARGTIDPRAVVVAALERAKSGVQPAFDDLFRPSIVFAASDLVSRRFSPVALEDPSITAPAALAADLEVITERPEQAVDLESITAPPVGAPVVETITKPLMRAPPGPGAFEWILHYGWAIAALFFALAILGLAALSRKSAPIDPPEVVPVRVEPRASVVPREAPEPAIENPPLPAPRPPRPPKPREVIATAPAIDLDRQLASRGLSRADLAHYPSAPADAPALLELIDSVSPPKTLISARLDAVSAKLAECGRAQCGDELARVEAEYLELRERSLRPRLETSLLIRTARLVRDAAQLRSGR